MYISIIASEESVLVNKVVELSITRLAPISIAYPKEDIF